MAAEALARSLLLLGAIAAGLEVVLAQAWAPIYWAGPSLALRRRATIPIDTLVASLGRASPDHVFTRFSFREIRPGLVALRENVWQRQPHLRYYTALRAHLRVEPDALSLAVFPTWSTLLLASGSVFALVAGWFLQLVGVAALLVLGFGAVVQSVRYFRLLGEATAGAGSSSASGA